MMSRAFARSLVFGFILCFCLLLAADKWASNRFSGSSNVATADFAKAHRLFWSLSSATSLSLLQNPSLFAQAFPGYPVEVAADSAFWRNYFRKDFDLSVWVNGDELMLSSFGNLTLFAKYGADVLILGNSETGAGLIPYNLSHGFGGKARVLATTRAGGTAETVRWAAASLVPSGSRAKVAVWGYSFWNAAYSSGFGRAEIRKQKLDFLRNGIFRPILADSVNLTGAQLFPALNWELLWKLNLQKIRHDRELRLRQQSSSNVLRALVTSGARAHYEDPDYHGLYLSAAFATDAAALAGIAEQIRPYYAYLSNTTAADCDMTRATRDLDAAIREIQKISDDLFIYLTPTTPLQTGAAPTCLREAVKAMLSSRSSEHVHIKLEDWKGYGLDWSDFLHAPLNLDRTLTGLAVGLDVNHLNFAGARKVSRRIDDWISREIRWAAP